MPKRQTQYPTLPAPLVLSGGQFIWVKCASKWHNLAGMGAYANEPLDAMVDRQALERRAGKGEVAAMAELIRRHPRYLQSDLIVETIRALRSSSYWARTESERDHASRGLELLARALKGRDRRGRRPTPSPEDVAELYKKLLPVYQAAKRAQRVDPINIGVVAEHSVEDLFGGRTVLPDGVEKEPPAQREPGDGRVALLPSYRFRICKADLTRLKDGEKPSTLALEKTAEIFGLGRGKPVDAVEWTRKLAQLGRRKQYERSK